METLSATLLQRVDELIAASKADEAMLTTTPQSVLIGELAARTEGLEKAIRLLAAEIHERSPVIREDEL